MGWGRTGSGSASKWAARSWVQALRKSRRATARKEGVGSGVRNSRIQDEVRANGARPRSQLDEAGAWSGSCLGCWGQSQVPLSARWESKSKAGVAP